ncbi:MAG: hypothetical protein OEU54_15865 [Gemmatimonadota bacterium]|nr:hypothetical protein [Gemmatimonadota bacterium]
MTARRARAFLSTLRKVERHLGVPVPARVKILRELEFDLEELRGRLEAEGLCPEEARARALEALVPDPGTLTELGELYTPRYRRLTGHLDQDVVRVLERSTLAIMAAGLLAAGALALSRADLFRDPSPFLWAVLALGGISIFLAAGEGFALWVKRDHQLSRGGPRLILALAGVTLGLGLFGALLDAYQLVATTGGAAAFMLPESFESFEWFARQAGLLTASLVLALAGGLAWFVLTQWLTLVSGARLDVLGLDPTATRQQEVR